MNPWQSEECFGTIHFDCCLAPSQIITDDVRATDPERNFIAFRFVDIVHCDQPDKPSRWVRTLYGLLHSAEHPTDVTVCLLMAFVDVLVEPKDADQRDDQEETQDYINQPYLACFQVSRQLGDKNVTHCKKKAIQSYRMDCFVQVEVARKVAPKIVCNLHYSLPVGNLDRVGSVGNLDRAGSVGNLNLNNPGSVGKLNSSGSVSKLNSSGNICHLSLKHSMHLRKAQAASTSTSTNKLPNNSGGRPEESHA
mmetsp:Transcript_12286/g.17725  ORF Transcript_12286/g.17725 Transcript_12286/m.17725 type:complete len:251 (-) Transcript_12286:67-819(-)